MDRKYRRPLIGWTGGKTRLVTTIIPIIDKQDYTTYVEPFVGGASIFLNTIPKKYEVINDVNPILINFYRQIQTTNSLKCQVCGTKNEFDQRKKKIDTGTWNICDYLTVNKHSFGHFMKSFNTKTIANNRFSDKAIKECNVGVKSVLDNYDYYHSRFKNVKIENKDYKDIIRQYDSPTTLFYVDPPYEGQTSKQYNVDLSNVSPQNIAKDFCNIQGKAIISFNDSKTVRQAFENQCKYQLKSVVNKYSINPTNQSEKKELLITNFSLEK